MLTTAPWDWPTQNVGLINIAAIIVSGSKCSSLIFTPVLFQLTLFPVNWILLGWGSDKIIIYLAKRNGGIAVPEHRLVPLILPLVVGVASFIGFGALAQNYFITNPAGNQPHWFALVFLQGCILMAFGGVLEVTYTYMASSTKPTDSLAAMTVVSVIRDLASFGMSYGVVNFATNCGYLVSFSVYAMLIAVFGAMGIPVYLYAQRLRERSV